VYKVLGMPVDIAWVLVAECPASAHGSLPRSGSALVTSPAVARTLLITAWDSTARGTWAQMERYSAKRLGDTMMLHFTRGPPHPSIDAAIVDAVVPRKTP
jgi:hypothetical protein